MTRLTVQRSQDGDVSLDKPIRSKSARLMYKIENPVQAKTSKMIKTSHPFLTFQRCFNFSIIQVYSYKNPKCSALIGSVSSGRNSSQNGSFGKPALQIIGSFLTGCSKKRRRACRLILASGFGFG